MQNSVNTWPESLHWRTCSLSSQSNDTRSASENRPLMLQWRPLADKIMSEFILPNSVNEVNLSKKTVVELNIHLNTTLLGLLDIEKALTIFDEAAEQIEHMLVSNHLRRFQSKSSVPKCGVDSRAMIHTM
ncbi:hypothetical protein BASA83_000061 [Batrachochytrium salamandrivorans]|nr:hypothetical protein BASA83_000061 [Batrachochytrium salamandrivorans]